MKNKQNKMVVLIKHHSNLGTFKNQGVFPMIMNYKEDPLLKHSQKFLDDKINLYSCLVKNDDFEKISVFKSVPYVGGKIFNELKDKINDDVLNQLENYMNRKILRKIVKNWLRTKVLPFPLIRVFSLNFRDSNKALSEYIQKIDFITNCQVRKKVRFPKTKEELLDNDAAYLYGCFLGDGCISGQLLKINDGHPNPQEIQPSRRHISNLAQFFKKLYNVDVNIKKIDNQYQLETVSKFLSRFFKFFYGFNKHNKIIWKPEIFLNNEKLLKTFYRGYFDADGAVKKEDKYICLKCVYAPFLEECKKDFQRWGINTSPVLADNKGVFQLRVLSTDMKHFATNIGFRHPRKQMYLSNHLKNGCALRIFKGFKKDALLYQFYDLSQIKDLRVNGIANIFKRWRQNLGTQKDIAKMLGTFRENVKRWENGEASIPFGQLIKVAKMNGFQKIDLFKIFDDRKSLAFSKGTLKQIVKLPTTSMKNDERLFSFLVPDKDRVYVKRYGIGYDIEEDLFNKVSEKFGKSIVKSGNTYCILSNLLSEFLTTFFEYDVAWKPLKENEISELQKQWNND